MTGTVLETELSSLFLLLMDEFYLIVPKEGFEPSLSRTSFLDSRVYQFHHLGNQTRMIGVAPIDNRPAFIHSHSYQLNPSVLSEVFILAGTTGLEPVDQLVNSQPAYQFAYIPI